MAEANDPQVTSQDSSVRVPGTNRKVKKGEISFWKWLLRNVIWAVILFSVLILGASLFLKAVTHHGQNIEVPDFTNKKVSEARYDAKLLGIEVEVADSVYIRRMGRGLVYSQNPKPGSHVKSGRTIQLTINSVTPKKVQMPDLVGLSMRQAKAELLSRGLTLGRLVYVKDMATNYVIRQFRNHHEMAPGTMIESGSVIDLEVGLNPDDNKTMVPSFKGMKYLRAVDAVHDNSLNVNRLIFDANVKTYGDSLDAVVYKQVPAPSSAPTVMGSEVTLYLSKDPLSLVESPNKK